MTYVVAFMLLITLAMTMTLYSASAAANQGQLSDLLRGEIAVEGQTRNERQRELPKHFFAMCSCV